MKRIIALVLSLALLLTGCGITPTTKPQESETPNSSETSGTISDDVVLIDPIENMELSYSGLNDDVLLGQIEDLIYTEAVTMDD